MIVIIDPTDDILYKSFYIYGLEQFFGRNRIRYSQEPFDALSKESRRTRSIRFIVEDSSMKKRYVIACNDSYQVIPELYDWCDVYGSVNANFDLTPKEYHPKLVSLCPSFAIRCWTPIETILYVIQGLSNCDSSIRKHLGKHKRLLRRVPYRSYVERVPVKDNYVFTCSTLWYNDEWNKNDENVNLSRAFFIRACKSIWDLNFEGGLVSSGNGRSSDDLFIDCLSPSFTMQDWLFNTKQSMCAFNTPAFWNCHGWKLGEYMALGKAIISTPLSNDLPAPLVHEKHIHIVENSQESMVDALKYIHSHREYREELEHNISEYWDMHGSPLASLKRLGL